MDVQMRSTKVKLSEPISLLSSLHNFRAAYETIVIHEDGVKLILQYFMKDPA